MAKDREVVVVVDEWSRLSDEEYAAAFRGWIAERLDAKRVEVAVSAAQVLRLVRRDGCRDAMTGYVVTVDEHGRLRLPDDVAARWADRTVLLVDHGGRLVMQDAATPPPAAFENME